MKWWTIIVPTIPALLAMVISYFNRKNIHELHISLNSRLSELLAATAAKNLAEGHEAGRTTEIAEQAARTEKETK